MFYSVLIGVLDLTTPQPLEGANFEVTHNGPGVALVHSVTGLGTDKPGYLLMTQVESKLMALLGRYDSAGAVMGKLIFGLPYGQQLSFTAQVLNSSTTLYNLGHIFS